jgi:hypothetical protein
LINHYRKFVFAFAFIAQPLYHLLKKDVSFRWFDPERLAFEHLKEALCCSPVLIYPDFARSFLLQTDALRDTIRAILSLKIDGDEWVVALLAYASRTLSKAEKNYAITDKEGLALIIAIKHFRPYLHGSHFVVEIDHAPLKALKTSRYLSGRLARWALILQSYNYEIKYKPGRLHSNADALTQATLVEPEPYSKFSLQEPLVEGPIPNQAMMIRYTRPNVRWAG